MLPKAGQGMLLTVKRFVVVNWSALQESGRTFVRKGENIFSLPEPHPDFLDPGLGPGCQFVSVKTPELQQLKTTEFFQRRQLVLEREPANVQRIRCLTDVRIFGDCQKAIK